MTRSMIRTLESKNASITRIVRSAIEELGLILQGYVSRRASVPVRRIARRLEAEYSLSPDVANRMARAVADMIERAGLARVEKYRKASGYYIVVDDGSPLIDMAKKSGSIHEFVEKVMQQILGNLGITT